jgi:hypothetical protein
VTALRARVAAAALWGPGLEGWEASLPVLRGEAPYEPRPSPAPPPLLLPPAERRRTGPVARLALAVAGEAAARSGLPPASLRAVFGSGNGDGPVVGSILEALAPGDLPRLVSPTQFHLSVHNAAAGLWSIATGNPEPATCLGCHDATWAAALLAAMADVAASARPVLLCAYDHPVPPPLDAKRPTAAPFGAGLVLLPDASPGRALARLAVRYRPGAVPAETVEPRAEALRPLMRGNPAAHALRLLEALARGDGGPCPASYLDGHLEVLVDPC